MSHPTIITKKLHRTVGASPKEGFIAGGDVATFDSDLGWMAAIRCDSLLLRLLFGYRSRAALTAALAGPAVIDLGTADLRIVDDWADGLVERLQAFAAGSPESFDDISLNMARFTPFQQRVVARCRRIGFGQTLTYGQLAAQAGHRGAARAVGQVMATNRFPIVVPCHRVIGSSGGLGGFSAPDGIRMKRRLLRSEGVEI